MVPVPCLFEYDRSCHSALPTVPETAQILQILCGRFNGYLAYSRCTRVCASSLGKIRDEGKENLPQRNTQIYMSIRTSMVPKNPFSARTSVLLLLLLLLLSPSLELPTALHRTVPRQIQSIFAKRNPHEIKSPRNLCSTPRVTVKG